MPVGIRAAHDRRQTRERVGLQAELFEHGVETAVVASMAPEYPVDIEWRGVEFFRDSEHLGGRHEQELRARIDESPDQPRAGHAIDFRSMARNPQGCAGRGGGRQAGGRHQRLAGIAPREMASAERFRGDSMLAQNRHCALADLLAFLTVNHDSLDRPVRRHERGDVPMVRMAKRRRESRSGSSVKILIDTDRSIITGADGVPIKTRESCETVISVGEGMAHPLLVKFSALHTEVWPAAGSGLTDAKLGLAPHGVFANPMAPSMANLAQGFIQYCGGFAPRLLSRGQVGAVFVMGLGDPSVPA